MKIAAFLLQFACASWAATPSEKALEKLQAAWDETKAYQADFTQSVTSKGSGLAEEPAVGKVTVVKPDRLRWDDETNHSVQILNGNEHWDITTNVRRKSRVVTHTKDITKLLGRSALAVLVGRGKFQEFYGVKLVSETAKEAVLRLTPKTDTSETLIAKIDKNGYVLRSLTTDSKDSKVVVEFKNTKRNTAFPDSLFSYEKQENDVFQTRKE